MYSQSTVQKRRINYNNSNINLDNDNLTDIFENTN